MGGEADQMISVGRWWRGWRARTPFCGRPADSTDTDVASGWHDGPLSPPLLTPAAAGEPAHPTDGNSNTADKRAPRHPPVWSRFRLHARRRRQPLAVTFREPVRGAPTAGDARASAYPPRLHGRHPPGPAPRSHPLLALCRPRDRGSGHAHSGSCALGTWGRAGPSWQCCLSTPDELGETRRGAGPAAAARPAGRSLWGAGSGVEAWRRARPEPAPRKAKEGEGYGGDGRHLPTNGCQPSGIAVTAVASAAISGGTGGGGRGGGHLAQQGAPLRPVRTTGAVLGGPLWRRLASARGTWSSAATGAHWPRASTVGDR